MSGVGPVPVADVLASLALLFALAVLTVATFGLVRGRDLYFRLHAASAGVVLGVVVILLAAPLVADARITARALLTAVFLLLTSPVASHALALAEWRNGKDHDE